MGGSGWGGMADPFADAFGQSLGLGGGRGRSTRGLGAQAARGMAAPPAAAGSAGGAASSSGAGASSSEGGNPPALVGGEQGTAAAASASAPAASAADDEGELGKASQAVVELATEKLHGNIGQVIKKGLFQ